MRIVVEIKRDGSPHTVMQQLFKHTALQTSFSANMLALVDGQPMTLGLKRMLEHYLNYRREVIRRRTEFDLARAQERAHILEGLKIALDNLDEVIATIRAAADVDAARDRPDAAASASPRRRPTPSWRCSFAASRPWSARRSRTSTSP